MQVRLIIKSDAFCRWIWSLIAYKLRFQIIKTNATHVKVQIIFPFCILSPKQQTPTLQGRMALMRRAVTARFRWKTCCPQSSLSLELSGEAKEIRLSLSVKLMLNFSIAEVACKQTLIATRCLLAALMIEHAQGIKVTGRFFFLRLFLDHL